MSRFMTPSKTAFLILIFEYCRGNVPATSTVSILSFIVTNILPSKTRSPAPLALEDFERVLSAHPSIITGRTIWDLLLKEMWGHDSADCYYELFEYIGKLCAEPKITPREDDPMPDDQLPGFTKLSRTSPLGAFVRRCEVEFTRLTFGDATLLWRDYVAFRKPSFNAWKKRNPSLSRLSFDANLAEAENGLLEDIVYNDLDTPRSGVPLYSTDDVDRLLDFQIAEMSKTGDRLPEDVDKKLTAMATSQITIPSAVHYVRFLDAWKAGNYPIALDNLHRYFDYTIQTRDKSHYQYALLNMALLHAHFGCHSEAISAMKETVSTARENKDMSCLNYSLSWLFHFGQQHPEEAKEIQKSGVLGNGKEALAFLRSKAKESGSWTLLSSTFVAEARLTILSGDGLAPAVENIARASHINLTKRNAAGLAGQMGIESVLWTRLGVSELAATKTELFLECHSETSTDHEKLGAICRMARSELARGHYREALRLMETVPSGAMRTLKTQTAWSTQTGILKLHHAILRDNLTAADHYVTQLQAIPNLDSDLSYSITLLHIEVEIKRGNLTEAMALLDAASKRLDTLQADISNRVKLMVLKARIWDRAGSTQKAFSVALRACSIAYEARLMIDLWPALNALCRVLNSLSEFNATRDMLVSCMPQILASADCEASAEAYSVLADAQMGLAGQAPKGSPKRKEEMTKCMEYLDRAFDDFSALEHVSGQCEMLSKRATILHLNGDYALANDCGARYLSIKQQNREELSA